MSSQAPQGAPHDRQYWLGWLAAALVVLIIVAVGYMAWQELAPPAATRAEVEMTPIVGGMALVTATPTATGDAAAAPTAAVITVTVAPAEPVTAGASISVIVPVSVAAELPSATVITAPASEPTAEPTPEPTATMPPTATPRPTLAPTPTPTPPAALNVVFTPADRVVGLAGRLTVYAEPSPDAPVLDSVGEGVSLTVLEPGGDYTAYPVIVAGHGWVRVRAADGLVGWVMTDTLVQQP